MGKDITYILQGNPNFDARTMHAMIDPEMVRQEACLSQDKGQDEQENKTEILHQPISHQDQLAPV